MKALFAIHGGHAFLHPARKRFIDWPRKKIPRAESGRPLVNVERDGEIVRRAERGDLYREIARAFGIKTQRVQQIVSAVHPGKGWKARVNQERGTA